jgi:hypothetical protein
MKFLRGLILSCVLLVPQVAQKAEPKGYDLGACTRDSFVPAHFAVTQEGLKVDEISSEPGSVEKVEGGTLYKYVSKDDKGASYESISKDGSKHRMILNFEKGFGLYLINDEPVAGMFISPDDDGSKLAENAMIQFKACINITSQKKDDSNISKT